MTGPTLVYCLAMRQLRRRSDLGSETRREHVPERRRSLNQLVVLGLWCYVARVRPGHPSGPVSAWFWTVLEFANGIGHSALAFSRGGDFPGVATAPVLLGVSTYLAVRLSTPSRS